MTRPADPARPVKVPRHDGDRYLVAAFGHTGWAENLGASGTGRLESAAGVEEIQAIEVPPGERRQVIDAYLRRFGRMPGVAGPAGQMSPEPSDSRRADRALPAERHETSAVRRPGPPAIALFIDRTSTRPPTWR